MQIFKNLLAVSSIALFALVTGCTSVTADDCETQANEACNECLDYEDDAADCTPDHSTFANGHVDCVGEDGTDEDAAFWDAYLTSWEQTGCMVDGLEEGR